MEQCLLSDIPAAQFEAVLHHLTSQDYGSLRQVSRAVSKRSTQHVPHLILRLSSSSSMQHVQQWCQATYNLQHVRSIHILISGTLMADVFDLTMQLLTQRTSITELHLLPTDLDSSISSSNARLPTLLPIMGMLDRLKALVISGVAVSNLPSDLQQIATAAARVAGWQLQRLTINAAWTHSKYFGRISEPGSVPWPEFPPALRHLYTAFPMLQQLQIKLPPLQYDPPTLSNRTGRFACSDRSLTDVAAAATVVNAAVKFQHLKQLILSGVYDIWKPLTAAAGQSAVATAAEATKAEAEDALKGAAAVLDSILSAGDNRLPSLSAATAGLGTLDDLGHLLLQHHTALKALRIGIEGSVWEMAWQQPQGLCCATASTVISPACSIQEIIASSRANELEAVLGTLDSSTQWDDFILQVRGMQCVTLDEVPESSSSSSSSGIDFSAEDSTRDGSSSRDRACISNESSTAAGSSSDGGVIASSSNDIRCPMFRFLRSLSIRSSRPATDLMPYIGSCELELYADDYADPLIDLLSGLTSLKDLEITLHCESYDPSARRPISDRTQRCGPPKVIKAVAAVEGLRSLTMHMQGLQVQLSDDLLLPLTAAAGGPGSNLKKLHLLAAGNFAAPRAQATTHAGFWHMLNQLDGLVDLSIMHYDITWPCRISGVNLPASLKTFRGDNVIIDSVSTAAASSSSSAPSTCRSDSPSNTVTGATCPSLHSLDLGRCRLSSPSTLASDQLQQLTVTDSSWSGGWAAAATSWPNLRQLVWRSYDSRISGKLASSARAVQDICAGFSRLGTLQLTVPSGWFSVEHLQPVVQHLNTIRYIKLKGDSSSSTDYNSVEIQQWLQEQLPWASVGIHLVLVPQGRAY